MNLTNIWHIFIFPLWWKTSRGIYNYTLRPIFDVYLYILSAFLLTKYMLSTVPKMVLTWILPLNLCQVSIKSKDLIHTSHNFISENILDVYLYILSALLLTKYMLSTVPKIVLTWSLPLNLCQVSIKSKDLIHTSHNFISENIFDVYLYILSALLLTKYMLSTVPKMVLTWSLPLNLYQVFIK